MLETRMLENVEAIFGFHVSHRVHVGSMASRSNPVLAACRFFLCYNQLERGSCNPSLTLHRPNIGSFKCDS